MKTINQLGLALLVTAGITLTSCKKETETTETETIESTETIENSTDTADGDIVVTKTDSITETNRDDKSMSGGEQVP